MRKTTVGVLTAAVFTAGLLAPAATAATAAPAGAPAAACSWRVETLPVPAGLDPRNIRVKGVDAQGNVAGSHGTVDIDDTLIRWSAGGGVEVVPKPAGHEFGASAQNAAGVVVGNSYRSGSGWSAFVHTPGKGYRQLAAPAGTANPRAVDINDRGDVLGEVDGSNRTTSVVWRADGRTEVIAPPGATFAIPVAIAGDGTVLVGRFQHLGIWRDGQLTKMPLPDHRVMAVDLTNDGVLGTDLLGSSWRWNPATGTTETFEGTVTAANDTGLALGSRSGEAAPVVWQGISSPTTLPLPAGATSGHAAAVSSNGFVAGMAGGIPVRWTCR